MAANAGEAGTFWSACVHARSYVVVTSHNIHSEPTALLDSRVVAHCCGVPRLNHLLVVVDLQRAQPHNIPDWLDEPRQVQKETIQSRVAMYTAEFPGDTLPAPAQHMSL
jgi:hypothetical protein